MFKILLLLACGLLITGVLTPGSPQASDACLDYLENPHWIGGNDFPGHAEHVVIEGDLAFVAAGEAGLQILDISDPDQVQNIGLADTPSYALRVAVRGSVALVADGYGGLWVIDVSNPSSPALVGFVPGLVSINDVTVDGDLAYVVDSSTNPTGPPTGRLTVIDISDPADPAPVGGLNLTGSLTAVKVRDGIAYVTGSYGEALEISGVLYCVDVASPASPVLVGENTDSGGSLTRIWYRDVVVQDNLAYVSKTRGILQDPEWLQNAGLRLFDIGDPTDPSPVGYLVDQNLTWDDVRVHLDGDRAYVAYHGYYDFTESVCRYNDQGLFVIDNSDPLAAEILVDVAVPGQAEHVAVAGGFAFVAAGGSGLQVVAPLDDITALPVSQVSLGSTTGIDVQGDLAFLTTITYGHLQSSALWIQDISDPANPGYVGTYSIPSALFWDVAANGNHAYVACGNVCTFDVSDPASPSLEGSTGRSCTRLKIHDGLLYALGDYLQIFSLASPGSPALLGEVEMYPFSARDLAIVDGVAYVAGDDNLYLFSVHNPASPYLYGPAGLFGDYRGVAVQGGLLFLTEDERGLDIVDINDPLVPLPVSTTAIVGSARGLEVINWIAYVAGNEAGLNVVDTSSPAAPRLLGGLDGKRITSLAPGGDHLLLGESTCAGGFLIVPQNCYDLPDITVLPQAMVEELDLDQTASQILTIGNAGDAGLDFGITVEAGSGGGQRILVGGAELFPETVIASGRPVAPAELDRLHARIPTSVTIPAPGTLDRDLPIQPGPTSGQASVPRGMEVFGSTANEFFSAQRTRGNLFTCTTSTILAEHWLYLDVPNLTAMMFLVYECDTQSGIYQAVSFTDILPSLVGEGWYSSGPINLPLTAGKFYMVCCSFQERCRYYNEQGISPYPIPTSFGELTGGVGWDWSPPIAFPPPTIFEIPPYAFDNPVAYHQALLVNPSPVSWLDVTPAGGSLPGGGSTEVNVGFDSAGLTPGEYIATLHVASNDPAAPVVSVPVSLTIVAPDISLDPPALEFSVTEGGTACESLILNNGGTGQLLFQIHEGERAGARPASKPAAKGPIASLDEPAKGEPDPRAGSAPDRGSGGPDGYGYTWTDSDEPGGPVFVWQDIRGIGTEIVLGDDDFLAMPLPFDFPFYGTTRTEIKICSNGYLTFGLDGSDYSNDPIPLPNDPNDFIAPFWDDFDPTVGGTIHHFHDTEANRFIVQYTELEHFSSGGSYTFEVILYPSGRILYQYLEVRNLLDSCTIGIENSNGSDGLQVVYNADYVHDELAVEIVDACPWLIADPVSGSVDGFSAYHVEVCVDAAGLSPGQYSCQLRVASNDPDTPEITVPVTLTVVPDGESLGDIFLSFAPDHYLSGQQIPVGVPFEWYVLVEVDFADIGQPGQNSSNGILGWEASVMIPAGITVLDRTLSPAGSVNLGDLDNWVVGTGSCVVADQTPYALVTYTGVLDVPAQDLRLGLGPSTPSSFLPPVPGWAVCLPVPEDQFRFHPDWVDHGIVINPSLTGVEDPLASLPVDFALLPNAPNPFNPRTEIRYDLPRPASVRLRVYDTLGRLVRSLEDGSAKRAGRHLCVWDGLDSRGSAVASGVYIYSLRAGDFSEARQMVLIR